MSMDYPLALELKNAGFPQKNGHKPFGDEIVCVPTLSELIEACGEKFGSLHRFVDYPAWYAYPYRRSSGSGEQYEGKTPEEAVARLWIQLNK